MVIGDIGFEEFVRLIDDVYDEIFIWDDQMRVVYANKACYRHYGASPEEFIGKKLEEFTEHDKLWSPTIVPRTFLQKKPMIQRQKTLLGMDIVTISVPVLDNSNNVKYVVQSVRDEESMLFRELEPVPEPESDSGTLEDEQDRYIYRSPAMKKVIKCIERIATTDAPVLLTGETGVGKTYLVRHLHRMSSRRDKPFISVNVASLNPSVIESEFFGYEAGAFTGARKGGRKGLFEAANGGTLFLDEIGELPLELQAKLLHTIQEEEILPVGSTVPVKLDVRMVYATNCDLKNMIRAGRFRQDFYQRINMLEVAIPPLRERREDLRLLTSFFLNRYNHRYARAVEIDEDVRRIFDYYDWPGNVRELSNVIERGVITAPGSTITVQQLPESFFSIDNIDTRKRFVGGSLEEEIDSFTADLIRKTYESHPSNRKLAEALSISQTKANRLIGKYITAR